MQRVALINWKNKNQDYDLSKIFSSIANPGVIEWLEVQNWKITPWYAFIEVERAWVKFNVLFQNTEDLVIDTTWTKKVFIEINQNNINDWTNNLSDWTWIWEIKTASDYPTKNFISLASITSWVITDSRSFIKFKWLKRKWLNINKILYVDSNWDEVELAYDTSIDQWKSIVISSTWLRLQSPSVNIDWLTEKIEAVDNDWLILSDSENSNINKKIKLKNLLLKDFWNGWDWNLFISTWTTTLNVWSIWSVWYLELQYKDVIISWWTLNFWNLQNNGNIVVIKVNWTFKMTWGTISASGAWWLYGNAGNATATNNGWWSWAKWSANDYPAMTLLTNFGTSWAWGAGVTFSWWVIACGAWGGWSSGSPYWPWSNWGRWGWCIIIVAKNINITWGTISANGLAWENNWLNASWGWGGWGGWSVLLQYRNQIAFSWLTIQVNGGWGWSWSTSSNTMSNGAWGGWSYSSWWNWWSGWYNSWVNGVNWTSNSYGTGWIWGVKWWWTQYQSGWGWWGGAWYYQVMSI